jgi:hypothetical protein
LQTAVEGETVSRWKFKAEMVRIDNGFQRLRSMIAINTALALLTLAAVLAT